MILKCIFDIAYNAKNLIELSLSVNKYIYMPEWSVSPDVVSYNKNKARAVI